MVDKKRSAKFKGKLRGFFSDKYVQQAQEKRLRSRAWFKLAEIQQSDRLFKPGMTIIDLGAAPGGWSKYAITQIGKNGLIIACDLLPMNSIAGVNFLQGDLCNELVLKDLLEKVGDRKIQVVMSDMAPNICGIPAADIPRAMYLVHLALGICCDVLAPNGSFVVKVFQGKGFEECLKEISSMFTRVKVRKPDSSHKYSREVYLVATGRRKDS